MPFEEIKTEDYRFLNFEQPTRTGGVSFQVVPIEGRDVTDNDQQRIESFLDDLRKWEGLIKASLYLLTELKLVQIDQATLQRYQTEFRREKYTINIRRQSDDQILYVHVYFSAEERRRRQGAGASSVLQVQEIHDQLKNIRKWKAFKTSLELIRRSIT